MAGLFPDVHFRQTTIFRQHNEKGKPVFFLFPINKNV